MKRKGYQVTFNNGKELKVNKYIYLSKKAAEESKDYIDSLQYTINEVTIVEDEESIAAFYNQIEEEDAAFQAAKEQIMLETLADIEAGNFEEIPPEKTREWLHSLSKRALAEDLYDISSEPFPESKLIEKTELRKKSPEWLTKISICGGD